MTNEFHQCSCRTVVQYASLLHSASGYRKLNTISPDTGSFGARAALASSATLWSHKNDGERRASLVVRLSTWQTTAVLFLTVPNAHCGQRTFRLAWCHEHSAATVTELLQPRDPACGTLFQFNYAIRTSPTDCSQTTAEGTPFSGSMNTMALCDFHMRRLRRTLTYLLTYIRAGGASSECCVRCQGIVLRVRHCDSRRIVFLPPVLYRDVLRCPPSFNTEC